MSPPGPRQMPGLQDVKTRISPRTRHHSSSPFYGGGPAKPGRGSPPTLSLRPPNAPQIPHPHPFLLPLLWGGPAKPGRGLPPTPSLPPAAIENFNLPNNSFQNKRSQAYLHQHALKRPNPARPRSAPHPLAAGSPPLALSQNPPPKRLPHPPPGALRPLHPGFCLLRSQTGHRGRRRPRSR